MFVLTIIAMLCRLASSCQDDPTCYVQINEFEPFLGRRRVEGELTVVEVIPETAEPFEIVTLSAGGGAGGETALGRTEKFEHGTHTREDSWAGSFFVFGNDNCKVFLFENADCTGESVEKLGLEGAKEGDFEVYGLSDTSLKGNVKCVTVFSQFDFVKETAQGRRRINLQDRERAHENAGFKHYDPLCDYLLADHFETCSSAYNTTTYEPVGVFELARNRTIKQWATNRLLNTCESVFYDEERLTQCKFYVRAVSAVVDDKYLNRMFTGPLRRMSLADQYQRCGQVTNMLHHSLMEGQNGVEIVEIDGEDYFKLEKNKTLPAGEMPTSHDAWERKEAAMEAYGTDVVTASVSIGSMLSLWLGTTLVKVCRDFDQVTGAWLWV